jgi:small subunit ribosomal protein S17
MATATQKSATSTGAKTAPKKVAKKAAASVDMDLAPRGGRVEVEGEVISDKMQKTISVLIYRLVKHKKYGKFMRRSSVFKAHDENNTAKIGDTVIIHQTRPLSKTKRWALTKVVKAATVTAGVKE